MSQKKIKNLHTFFIKVILSTSLVRVLRTKFLEKIYKTFTKTFCCKNKNTFKKYFVLHFHKQFCQLTHISCVSPTSLSHHPPVTTVAFSPAFFFAHYIHEWWVVSIVCFGHHIKMWENAFRNCVPLKKALSEWRNTVIIFYNSYFSFCNCLVHQNFLVNISKLVMTRCRQ